MARRRYRRNEGLLAVACRSDWKFSATLAVGLLAAAIFLPAIFGRSAITAILAAMFVPVAWVLAVVFCVIALLRFQRAHTSADPTAARRTARSPCRLAAANPSAAPAGFTCLDNAWLQFPSSGGEANPSRPTAWSLEVLDRIEWKRFEDLCCAFYREKGIRAETTRLGADGGVDVRLFQDDADPTRLTAIVQCKALNKQVGVKPVRELRGVMFHEKVEKAVFMAPNGFSDEARAFAAANRVTLLDGKLFLAMLKRLPEASSQRLLAFATDGAWTTPTCPSCGSRMTARESKRGAFWGCTTYPRCRGRLPMRAHLAAAPI